MTRCLLFLLLLGCARYSPDRLALSDARVASRQAEAEAYSLEEKAAHWWARLHQEHVQDGAVSICAGDEVVSVEHTAAYLALLAWRHEAIGDCTEEIMAAVGALRRFDEANGALDGRLCKTMWKDVAVQDEAHSNVYVQVVHAYAILVDFIPGGLRSTGPLGVAAPRTLAGLAGQGAAASVPPAPAVSFTDGKGPTKASGAEPVLISALAAGALYRLVSNYAAQGWCQRYDDGTEVPGTRLNPFEPGDALTLLLFLEVGEAAGLCVETDREALRRVAAVQCVSLPGLFIPTHSSVWLTWLKLDALCRIKPEEYQPLAENLWQATQAESNPLWGALAERCGVEGAVPWKQGERGNTAAGSSALCSAPLFLDDSETINSHRPLNFRVRWIKNRFELEAVPALPLYARPQEGWEWKRDQFRTDGNLGKDGACRYSGLDYLQAYFAAKGEG